MIRKVLLFVVPIAVAGALWEITSRSGIVNIALFPPPSRVAIALWSMVKEGVLFSDLRDSLWRVFAGLAIGSSFGIVLGIFTGRVKPFAAALSPIIQMLRSLPPVAIVPLIIVWFGIDDGAKIFSIAFAVFFPVWLNSHIGSEQISRVLLWSAEILTSSTIKKLTGVVFPAALPFIVAGIRNAIPIAFIMVFVSELAGASSGLGYRIAITQLAYRIDEMMAALFVLGTLGAMTDQLFTLAIKKLFPWFAFIEGGVKK